MYIAIPIPKERIAFSIDEVELGRPFLRTLVSMIKRKKDPKIEIIMKKNIKDNPKRRLGINRSIEFKYYTTIFN